MLQATAELLLEMIKKDGDGGYMILKAAIKCGQKTLCYVKFWKILYIKVGRY